MVSGLCPQASYVIIYRAVLVNMQVSTKPPDFLELLYFSTIGRV